MAEKKGKNRPLSIRACKEGVKTNLTTKKPARGANPLPAFKIALFHNNQFVLAAAQADFFGVF